MPESSLPPGDRFYNINAIRKTLFGLPKFCESTRVVLLVVSASKVNFWKVRIERERAIEGILSPRALRRPAGFLSDTLDLRNREICPGQRKIRIQLNCVLVQVNCTLDITF